MKKMTRTMRSSITVTKIMNRKLFSCKHKTPPILQLDSVDVVIYFKISNNFSKHFWVLNNNNDKCMTNNLLGVIPYNIYPTKRDLLKILYHSKILCRHPTSFYIYFIGAMNNIPCKIELARKGAFIPFVGIKPF